MRNEIWAESSELSLHIGWFLLTLSVIFIVFLGILLLWIRQKWMRDQNTIAVRLPKEPSILIRPYESLLIGGKGCQLEIGDAPRGTAFATLRWNGTDRTRLEIVPIIGSVHIDHSPRIRTYGEYHLGQLLKIRYDRETYETRILDASWQKPGDRP